MTNRKNTLLILIVLALFSALGVARHLHMYGEDLASSYVGCRLLAAGEGSHLYSHSPTDFSAVGDPAWSSMALRTGYTSLKYLHPYVQTPLWVWSLQPVCTRMNFRVFCDLYIVLFMMCASSVLYLVARYWTPSLLHPGWIAFVFAAFYVSEPFKYSIFLAQTHMLYLLLTVAALMLAERDESVWAGIALALAALVKITPGLLLVYWLMTRQWKAAASFALAFASFSALTVFVAGPEMTRAYVHSLAENGNVLLLAFNNQSFAAWWMGRGFPRSEITKWRIYQIPPVLKAVSILLCVAGAVLGGWLDRANVRQEMSARRPPFGAVLAMVAATAFTSIAWSHYYILLVIPAMLLLQAYGEDGRPLWLGFLLCIFALNLYPISYGDVHLLSKSFSIVRSQFYSGLITIGSLVCLSLLGVASRHGRQARSSPLSAQGVA